MCITATFWIDNIDFDAAFECSIVTLIYVSINLQVVIQKYLKWLFLNGCLTVTPTLVGSLPSISLYIDCNASSLLWPLNLFGANSSRAFWNSSYVITRDVFALNHMVNIAFLIFVTLPEQCSFFFCFFLKFIYEDVFNIYTIYIFIYILYGYSVCTITKTYITIC